MDFESRIEELNRVPALPAAEIEAAIQTLERLRTAQAICESAFGSTPSVDRAAIVGAVLAELGAAARWIIEDDRAKYTEDTR